MGRVSRLNEIVLYAQKSPNDKGHRSSDLRGLYHCLCAADSIYVNIGVDLGVIECNDVVT